ncbi:MAG: hypothetical protein FWB74_06930 [Defluviitaleaceae bacterium]|nr:hypothetical protein [Defluviitaleaceae bacterium]
MAIETKMLINALAEGISRATSVREAYGILMRTANVEGINLPSYDDAKQGVEEERRLGEEDKK